MLCIASLTNVAFPHIVRARFLRPATLPIAVGWLAAITVGAIMLPHRPQALRPFLDVGSAYFLALCALQTVRLHRQARAQRSSRQADSSATPVA